jgi:AraC-like DNA-binding protein
MEDGRTAAPRGASRQKETIALDQSAPPLPGASPAPPEAMKAWRFSTDSYPAAERHQAWREVMTRLRLPLGEPPEQDSFHGEVSCIVSPLGMDFAVMSASPQVISGRNPNQPAAVWLVVLLDGEASFFDGDTTVPLEVGDIAYGPTGMNAALRMTTPFRLLFISAPRVALDHRLIAPLSLRVGRLRGDSGLGHVFSGLLRATADTLGELRSEQLRPMELALTEFLVANLAAEGSPAAEGGAKAARAAHLHRICQTIETMLAEPDLTLEQVADADGISARSVQKLFAAAGQNFSTYLRTRRLERCRLDLTSPMFASLSISEICFRWGFNGSAHFSRAFKDQYGVSPRDYRRSQAG